jgi:hypothetical protein
MSSRDITWACSHCGVIFSTSEALRTHLATEHGGRLFTNAPILPLGKVGAVASSTTQRQRSKGVASAPEPAATVVVTGEKISAHVATQHGGLQSTNAPTLPRSETRTVPSRSVKTQQQRTVGVASVPAPPTTAIVADADISPTLASALVILVAGFGVFLVAAAGAVSRAGGANAESLFWAGLLTIVVPLAWRASGPQVQRFERLGLLICGVVALYAVKVFLAPSGFAFTGDEFVHIRTAQDILASHHLFNLNPINLISPRYPGLEIITVALAQTAGLRIFVAGLIIIGVARLLVALSLFYIFEIATTSSRVAVLGVFIYFANPNFLFEGSQFSYESLGLPLAIFAVFAAVRALDTRGERQAGVAMNNGLVQGGSVSAKERTRILSGLVVCTLVIAATIPTHHTASYALAFFFLLWGLVTLVMRRGSLSRYIAFMGLAACAGAATWVVFVAPRTWSYLTQNPSEGVAQLVQILTRSSPPKRLFTSGGETIAPQWEQIVAFTAVGVLIVSLPFGLFYLWRRCGNSSLAWVLGLAAAAYPASLALRLTTEGTETSNRASEYVFVGLALALGVFAVAKLGTGRAAVRRGLFAALLGVVLMGGVMVGWAPHARLPGPFLVAAGSRSIDPQGEEAARWLLAAVGPGHRLAADRTDTLLMAVLGRQYSLTAGGGEGSYWPLFFDSTLTQSDLRLIRMKKVEYVVIDRRLALGRPLDLVYIEGGEPNVAIVPQALAKFDSVPGVSRIYDSGAIQIYDVRALARGQAVR